MSDSHAESQSETPPETSNPVFTAGFTTSVAFAIADPDGAFSQLPETTRLEAVDILLHTVNFSDGDVLPIYVIDHGTLNFQRTLQLIDYFKSLRHTLGLISAVGGDGLAIVHTETLTYLYSPKTFNAGKVKARYEDFKNRMPIKDIEERLEELEGQPTEGQAPFLEFAREQIDELKEELAKAGNSMPTEESFRATCEQQLARLLKKLLDKVPNSRGYMVYATCTVTKPTLS